MVILFSAKKTEGETTPAKRYIPYIMVAMLSSGGLGIMQKVQGRYGADDEKVWFLLVGFALAFTVSLLAYLFCGIKSRPSFKFLTAPMTTGLCFGGANLFNTILAGKMNSAVFFPLQNISTILLTTLFGLLVFKEQINKKTVAVLLLSIAVIMMFSL
jgi:drug/metabolite transporter (DMT)-like permease